METFFAWLALCAGNSPVPVNSPHKGQWRGALMFSLIYVWINDWVNSREAGELRRHRGHYDVIVMAAKLSFKRFLCWRPFSIDISSVVISSTSIHHLFSNYWFLHFNTHGQFVEIKTSNKEYLYHSMHLLSVSSDPSNSFKTVLITTFECVCSIDNGNDYMLLPCNTWKMQQIIRTNMIVTSVKPLI